MTDLRTIEKESIRAFVQRAADGGYLSGRVLDYGCGKQPYRDIVEAAGCGYVAYDRAEFGGNVSGEDVGFVGISNWMWNFDAILCTQVVQYVPISFSTDEVEGIQGMLGDFHLALNPNASSPPEMTRGHLVLTWPICWPLVEVEDLHRFTISGMERLLTDAGFEIVHCEVRAEYKGFPIGGQAVARA